MSGKMPVGVRAIESEPRNRIGIDTSMNVLGCLSASLTIHIIHLPAWPDRNNQIDLKSYASVSWCLASRSIAQWLAAQQLLWTEQCPLQESSCRRHSGCRHCLGGLSNPRERPQQTNYEPSHIEFPPVFFLSHTTEIAACVPPWRSNRTFRKSLKIETLESRERTEGARNEAQ
jgi:hypothetical protein